MLQLNYIRENAGEIIDRLSIKNYDAKNIINKIIELDQYRRETQNLLDECLAKSNSMAKEIGKLYKSGRAAEANEFYSEMANMVSKK